MPGPVIGILALQGAFAKHVKAIEALGASVLLVRHAETLEQCDGLIIPGGESTTISKGIDFIGMRDALLDFAASKPIFGTCAGLIILSKQPPDTSVHTLGVLDVEVERNSYGAQTESFAAEVTLLIKSAKTPLRAIFIRAPRIISTGPHVKALAYFEGEPVLVSQGNLLASSFHPELTEDLRIHRHFLSLFSK